MDSFLRALHYSYRLLRYRLRSKKEIEKRLKDKGYSTADIKKVVNTLINYGYIDDNAFVDLFIRSKLKKGWSKLKILFELKKFGVAKNLVEEKISSIDRVGYLEKIKQIYEKRINRYKDKPDCVKRTIRYLTQRGFSYQDIKEAVDEDR